jgi:hypothetical protein
MPSIRQGQSEAFCGARFQSLIFLIAAIARQRNTAAAAQTKTAVAAVAKSDMPVSIFFWNKETYGMTNPPCISGLIYPALVP